MTLCGQAGWTVAVNRPFAGALVPMAHYRRDARVRAIMIEVNRRLYLDEQTGARSAAFERCRTALSAVLHHLIEATEDMSPICGQYGARARSGPPSSAGALRSRVTTS